MEMIKLILGDTSKISCIKRVHQIVMSATLCFLSSFASANIINEGWIYADDYSVGTVINSTVEGVTLDWITHESGADSLAQSPSFVYTGYCAPECKKAFGGPTPNGPASGISAGTLNNAEYFTNFFFDKPLDLAPSFINLRVNFDQSVSKIGFQGFSQSSDSWDVFLFDTDGRYIEEEHFRVYASGDDSTQNCGEPGIFIPCHTYSGIWDLGFDIGSFAVGSSSSAGYINGIYYAVPEPSVLSILFTGLIGLGIMRRKQLAS